MTMQIAKSDITKARLVDAKSPELEPGEIRVRIDRFGYSANNVTYAAAGDTLNYWKFFPTPDEGWGVVPVWGFADVEASRCDDIAVGERLFGYFPPAPDLVLRPSRVGPAQFTDATPHRAELPAGYNLYRRVEPAPAEAEDRHMLLFPLYVTSWCLWDAMRSADWHGAERVIVASASSKTAIGLAFALAQDDSAPPVTALTSARNVGFVEDLGFYDDVLTYDDIETLGDTPSVVVDMSGDAAMLGRLHTQLGDAMRQTLDVGLTHWEAPRRDDARNRERSQFFFAPAHIAARVKEWGGDVFAQRTRDFMADAIADSRRWLDIDRLEGLEALVDLHPRMASGTVDPSRGVVIGMPRRD